MLRRQHVVLALVLTSTACARSGRRGAVPQTEPAIIFFRNETLAQADVFAVTAGGAQVRIGTVMPGRTDSLRLRMATLGSGGVSIVARLLASPRRPTTGPLTINPGERLLVTLPAQANMLNVLPADR